MSTPSRPLAALNSRSSRLFPASAISLAAQARLASTSTSTSSAATATPPPPAAAAAPAPPTSATDALATDSNPFDIGQVSEFGMAQMPERLGYLKDVGLDYGWGPTSMIEWTLEHVHVLSGMPWWASIAATACVYRLALVPLFIKSSENGAKMRAMLPLTKPLNDKMMAAMKDGDRTTAMQLRQELMQMNKAAGVGTFDVLLPALMQGVFGFCAFRLLRAMANLPVPGFETGGFLWITDLTQGDPYFLLPAIMGITLHGVMRMGGETGQPMNEGMKPIFLYIMPGIVFITTSWLPAALNIWLSVTGLMGITQVSLFRRPEIRRIFGLSPIVSAEQAQRDAVARGLAQEPQKTIDIQAKSRPAAQRPVYQAPNLKFSGSQPTPAAPAATADAPIQAAGALSGVTDKSVKWFNGVAESLNKSKEAVGDAVRNAAARVSDGGAKKQSKTRNAEFQRQADDYERRWKKFNDKK